MEAKGSVAVVVIGVAGFDDGINFNVIGLLMGCGVKVRKLKFMGDTSLLHVGESR